MMTRGGRGRRWLLMMAGAILLLAVGAAATWATITIVQPAEDPLEETSYTYVTVDEGEIGSSLALNVIARWEPVPVGINRASGVVTDILISAGDEVSQGTTVYTVDLRPVVVAQGTVPSFRDIGLNQTGPDVKQLQTMLADLGFYYGAIDGEAGRVTISAIKRWQHSLGLDQSGSVLAGDLIFVPRLPARMALDEEIMSRGATLSGGEVVASGLEEMPSFTASVTEAQVGMMPVGTRVEVTSPDGEIWEASIGGQTKDEETGNFLLALTTPDGTPVCADQCDDIPVAGETSLPSRIITVEPVSGLVVPSAALATDPGGSFALVDKNSDRIPVEVKASANGMSVVTGVAAGTRVRLPAADGGMTE